MQQRGRGMELSNQFTKEQLIAKAQEQIEFIRRTQVTGAGREHVDMCGELFEIALASLTAEAVAWTDEQELRDVEKGGCGYLFTVKPVTPNADPRRVIKLYVTPPAQVVPKTLQCSVELKPGLIIGKGCKTDTLLRALQNRATILKGGAK